MVSADGNPNSQDLPDLQQTPIAILVESLYRRQPLIIIVYAPQISLIVYSPYRTPVATFIEIFWFMTSTERSAYIARLEALLPAPHRTGVG